MGDPVKQRVMQTAGPVRLLRNCLSLTPSHWGYLIRASFELLRARIFLIAVSDNVLISSLRMLDPELKDQGLSLPDREWIQDNGKAIMRAAVLVPWRSDCLVQAMAANRVLRRRGLQPMFYLGVRKETPTELLAHCWLDCCGLPVVGETNEKFSVLIEPDLGVFTMLANH